MGIPAGAEVLDISHNFGIGYFTAYYILHDTVEVMNSVFLFPKLPCSEAGMQKTAMDFKISRSQISPLDECVGALDGICRKLKNQRMRVYQLLFTAVRATTRFRSKRYAMLTTCFVMRPVFAVVPHTIL